MNPKSPSLLAALALAAATWMVPAGGAAAAPEHLIPQSLQLRHKETLEQILALTKREGEVGVAAGKVLALLKRHTVREVEYIFPPLTLLPRLTDGKVTPDMA